MNYKTLYLKYKSKYTNLQNTNNFCNDIYSNQSDPINIFLINLQRKHDIGYFNEYCKFLDGTSTSDYKLDFADKLPFSTKNNPSIDYLINLKTIFEKIITEYNNDDIDIVYTKKNRGLTIILKFCVIRIMSLTQYNNLKRLYDMLSLDRKSNLLLNHFEKIYNIFVLNLFNVVIIVSEKVETVKNVDGSTIKPQFENKKVEINNFLISINEFLQNNNFDHGDLSFDNTGYRRSDNRYVVFDFDNTVDYMNKEYEFDLNDL